MIDCKDKYLNLKKNHKGVNGHYSFFSTKDIIFVFVTSECLRVFINFQKCVQKSNVH